MQRHYSQPSRENEPHQAEHPIQTIAKKCPYLHLLDISILIGLNVSYVLNRWS